MLHVKNCHEIAIDRRVFLAMVGENGQLWFCDDDVYSSLKYGY